MRTTTAFLSFRGPRYLAIATASLTTLLVACGGATSPTGGGGGGNNPLVGARVIGVVTDGNNGEPVPLVTMRATMFVKNGTCATQPLVDPFETMTDEEGNYLINMNLPGNQEFDACVSVEALPPPSRPDLPPDLSQEEVEVRPWLEGIETITANFALKFDAFQETAPEVLRLGR